MTVATILEKMTDTADPVNGAVFEKQIETDIVSFDALMRASYKKLKGSMDFETGHLKVLYYASVNEEHTHVGTFDFDKSMGCFGGIRLGSQNPFLKDHGVEFGTPFVKNPFKAKG